MTALPQLNLTPHDLDAERAVLGSVMIRGNANDVLGVVSPADMFLPAHRETFDAILTIAARRDPIDAVTVANALRASGWLARVEGQEAWVLSLYNAVPTAESGAHYARLVRDKARARRLVAACLDAISRASEDTADEALGTLRVAMSGLGTTDGGPALIADVIGPYLETLEERARKPEGASVSTGLQALDNVVHGHRAGQAIVIAGRPGTGKSAHAFSTLVRAARDGVPGLFFGLEMSREEMLDRAMALESGVEPMRAKPPGITVQPSRVRAT